MKILFIPLHVKWFWNREDCSSHLRHLSVTLLPDRSRWRHHLGRGSNADREGFWHLLSQFQPQKLPHWANSHLSSAFKFTAVLVACPHRIIAPYLQHTYMCVHTHMHRHKCVRMYIDTHMHTQTHTHITHIQNTLKTYVYSCTSTYTCMRACTHRHIRTHKHVYTYTDAGVHMHMQTHLNMNTHTHICRHMTRENKHVVAKGPVCVSQLCQ